MILANIRPPHRVKEVENKKNLVRAYENSDPITPVVALEWEKGKTFRIGGIDAISGSHRIAAMLRVFGGQTDVQSRLASYIIVENGDAIYARIKRKGNSSLLRKLRDMHAHRLQKYKFLVDDVIPYLSEKARQALADQGDHGKRQGLRTRWASAPRWRQKSRWNTKRRYRGASS